MKYLAKDQGEIISQKDYSKRIIFTAGDLKSKGNLVQVVTIKPAIVQRPHFHKIQTEVFYILEGQAYLVVNDKKILAKPGDAFVCEPKEKHQVINKFSKEVKILVFKINLPKTDDTVWKDK